ncbi:hypothetical protein GCM10029992_01800 [Glycomyces albus]
MLEIAIGVFSSIVGSGVLLFVGWLASVRVRKVLTNVLARLARIDVELVFPTQSEAYKEIVKALTRAREIYIFAGRGSELTRSHFKPLWDRAGARVEKLRILLPNPDIAGDGSWFADREKENASHDNSYGDNLIAQQVRANLRYIARKAQDLSAVEVRLYDFPHLGRIILTDKVAFLTGYTESEHGSDSPCIMFNNRGPMYDFCKRIVQKAWLRSIPSDEASGVQ